MSESTEAPALSQMGATFAERKKAREAAGKRASKKAVSSDDEGAENKAVKSASKKS